MLKIRLKRVGRRNNPSFRVVLVESQKGPQTGKINEILGFYDPKIDKNELKADRIKHWIDHGAQVSDTVHNLLVSEGIIEGKKINVLPKKSPVVKEEKEEKPKEEVAPAEGESPAEESAPETTEEGPKEEEATEEQTTEESKEEEKVEEAPKEEEKPLEETPKEEEKSAEE